MRKLFLLLLLIGSFVSNSFCEDRRIDKTSLTIMTFNAEFLWDEIDPEEGSSRVEFDWKNDPIKATTHMERIAGVVNKNNPDIIN